MTLGVSVDEIEEGRILYTPEYLKRAFIKYTSFKDGDFYACNKCGASIYDLTVFLTNRKQHFEWHQRSEGDSR